MRTRARRSADCGVMRNKANPRRGRQGRNLGDEGRRYKQTQFAADGPERPSPRPEALTMPPARGQTCETKPIHPATLAGARPEGRGTRGRRAKRTQFGPAWPGRRRAKDAKQTQFVTRRTGAGWTDRSKRSQLVPLEGVGRGRPTYEEPRGNRAKQSQFPQDRPEEAPAAGAASAAARGVNRAKQTQFPWSAVKGKSLGGKELW
jgi:hypothetical protein